MKDDKVESMQLNLGDPTRKSAKSNLQVNHDGGPFAGSRRGRTRPRRGSIGRFWAGGGCTRRSRSVCPEGAGTHRIGW